MLMGEKIREARRKCGFSQEQLAEKMSVSRSAVAKWETDKGLPDVGNLKMLARLLRVSVDHLLDEGQTGGPSVIRENYNLSAYGYGCNRVKKDRVVRERYPDAAICPLLARQDPGNPDFLSQYIPVQFLSALIRWLLVYGVMLLFGFLFYGRDKRALRFPLALAFGAEMGDLVRILLKFPAALPAF